MEEARALAAHANLDDRTPAEREKKPGDLVGWTFRTLEKSVIRMMNDPSVSLGRVALEFNIPGVPDTTKADDAGGASVPPHNEGDEHNPAP